MRRRVHLGVPSVGLLMASAMAGAVGVVMGTTGTADAHTELVGSSPAPGATVATPVQRVTLDFEEPPSTRVLQVAVIGPDGRDLVRGTPRLLGARVIADVRRPTRPGSYEISYRVAAADDHPETGSVRFTISRAASSTVSSQRAARSGPVGAQVESQEPPASPAFRQAGTAEPPGGADVLPWAALGVMLVGLSVSVTIARRAARSNDAARFS